MDRKRFECGASDLGRLPLITRFFLFASIIIGRALLLDEADSTRFSVLYVTGVHLALATLALAAYRRPEDGFCCRLPEGLYLDTIATG
jgi:hypothetical protein